MDSHFKIIDIIPPCLKIRPCHYPKLRGEEILHGVSHPPAISVIVPAYNHEAYIGKAVTSILSQTLTDIEIIIIDDASSDKTAEKIASFSDARIFFMKNEKNIGSAATINKGIRRARGEFISILNSDDCYHPERLEFLLNYAKKFHMDGLITDIELIDKHGSIIRDKTNWWIEWYEDLKSVYRSTNNAVTTVLGGNFSITTSNFFIRRNVFEKIGYFYDYRYVVDYEFLLRFLADRPKKFSFLLEEKLLFYRLHDRNTISESPLKANQETFVILSRWAPEFFKKDNRTRLQDLLNYLGVLKGYMEMELRSEFDRELEKLRHVNLSNREEIQRLEDDNQQYLEQIQKYMCEIEEMRQRYQLQTEAHEKDIQRYELQIAAFKEQIERFNREVQLSSDDLTRLQAAIPHMLSEVYDSASYRLGYSMLQPLRIFKKILGNEKDNG